MATLNPFSNWPVATDSLSPALLAPTERVANTTVTLKYVTLSPNVLNCIIAQDDITLFRVTTPPERGSRTIIRRWREPNPPGEVEYSIDWDLPSIAWLSNGQPKVIGQWLGFSAVRRGYVFQVDPGMIVGGARYFWRNHDNGDLCLERADGTSAPNPPLVRMYHVDSPAQIVVELTTEIIQNGLLDAVIIAGIVFHSGRTFR
ncbi:hypothetical protein MD484_g2518, partial [Candolleomyces efflorescens]